MNRGLTRSLSARFPIVQLLLALSILLAGGRAVANDDAYQKARALFLQGRTAYNEGRYPAALTLFRQAQQLFPSDKVGLSIAFTLEKMGYVVRAAESYERYLIERSGEVSQKVEHQVRAKLDQFRKSLATVEISTALEGALIKIDGRAKMRTPQKHRLYVRPGAHRLTLSTVENPSYFSKELDLRAGQHMRVLVDMQHSSATPKSRSTSRPFYRRWWFWTAVGAVVVASTVGIVAASSGGSDWVPHGDMGTIDLRP